MTIIQEEADLEDSAVVTNLTSGLANATNFMHNESADAAALSDIAAYTL